MGGEVLLTAAAIRDESSGYFLVAAQLNATLSGRIVSESEAASIVGHCMPGGPAANDPPCPNCAGGGPGGGNGPGMPGYSFHPQKVSVLIDDVPVGYTPTVGPVMNFQLSYDHRESRYPQTFTFGNAGPMWSHNWMSYVTNGTLVHWRGHGQENFQTWVQQPFTGATLVKVADEPVRYERRLPNGSIEVFTAADRPSSQPNQKVFLTEVIDPQGHSVTLTYDSSTRLVALTDAIGQVTTLDYLDSADPLHLTKVTDPFGRIATLTYDSGGRLASITDAAGMSSSFAYGEGDFITALTTPYGTTTFRHEPQFAGRVIEATDPAGGTERLAYYWSKGDIPTALPAETVPTGFSALNDDMHKYNVLYWDKLAMAAGPTTANATITSLLIAPTDIGGHGWARNIPHSVKRPLESRVWYAYANSTGRSIGGAAQPVKIGRVLDGGESQITQITYNAKRLVTSRIDPAGRQTNYTYASNGLDLLQVEQVRSGGTDVLQAYANYNADHLPGTITDAAGQDTDFTYNAAGQPLTVTNAKNETTTYTYETGTNNLLTVTGAVTGATTTYSYDAYGRVESVEDADGYVVVSDYDNLNRLTQRTYPDATTETLTYNKLSLAEQKDRLGRITRHFYDAFGRRIATRDPAGRAISQVWCDCGAMEALVDANGNRTTWERDVQGRVTREVRADNITDTLYTYDLSGRLKTVTDPKDQVTTHSYNIDDSLSGTAYTSEQIETPNVSYTYDTYYARVTTMVDGIGTTSYAYVVPGANGAGQVASVDGLLSNDTLTYSYDQLGRVIQRTINGSANEVDWTFDALGRVTSEANLLGEFTYAYAGVTSRLATLTYPTDQTSTYSYFDDEGDHRLQAIHHKYPNASTLSKFDYTYDAVGNILSWRQQADSTAVAWKYGYDYANQLTSAVKHATDTLQTMLQRFAYAYDPAGNRTVEQIDDSITLSAYDNLNRLTSLAPGGPMLIMGSLNEGGTVTISGTPAVVDPNNSFSGTVPMSVGTNTFTIVARDATGNATTQQYEADVAGVSKTFAFEESGNLTGDGTRTFEWDARNQVVAVTVGPQRSEFTYDGQQRRVRLVEKVNGAVQSDTRVIWCEMVICEERAADGTTVNRRAFKHGEQVGGAARFLVTDHIGSITEVADTSGTVLGRYAYDPWGRRTVTAGAGVTSESFTGHQWQSNSSLLLSFYRGYDPDLGIWISEDPIGLSEGPNFYRYVAGNPVRYQDPLGLAIHCTVSSIREQSVGGKCPPGAGACTDAAMRASASGCRQSSCGTWSFTGTTDIRYTITYLHPKRSKGADGNPYETHEWSHVGDLQGWCSGLSSKYPSEGFSSVSECNAARTRFLSAVRQGFRDARNDSNIKRDK